MTEERKVKLNTRLLNAVCIGIALCIGVSVYGIYRPKEQGSADDLIKTSTIKTTSTTTTTTTVKIRCLPGHTLNLIGEKNKCLIYLGRSN